MDNTEYLKFVALKEKQFEDGIIIDKDHFEYIRQKFLEFIKLAKEIDEIKSSIIYADKPSGKHIKLSEQNVRILHAFTGMVSELGEMLQDFTYTFDCENLDNFIAELGDYRFYEGILLNIFKLTQEQIHEVNEQKLNKRYKNGFTIKESLERNTKEENKIISNKISKIKK